MRSIPFRLASFLALILAGCASGPSYQQTVAGQAPVAAGMGRIVVYMDDAVDVPSFHPGIAVDGASVGQIRAGSFFTLVRPAGPHQVGIATRQSLDAFGNEGASPPVSFDLLAGADVYVQVDIIATVGMVKPTVTLEDPETAQRILSHLNEAPPIPDPPE